MTAPTKHPFIGAGLALVAALLSSPVGAQALPVSTYTLAMNAGGREIEMNLSATSDHRLLAWQVPSQSYSAVRVGYEALK